MQMKQEDGNSNPRSLEGGRVQLQGGCSKIEAEARADEQRGRNGTGRGRKRGDMGRSMDISPFRERWKCGASVLLYSTVQQQSDGMGQDAHAGTV